MGEEFPRNNQENLENDAGDKESSQANAWDELQDVENESFNPQSETEESLGQNLETAAKFRAEEERLTGTNLAKEVHEREILLERFRHEPSAELRQKIKELGTQIDVDSDFYGEISDPDDDRAPSEIWSDLSKKYLRVAERSLKQNNNAFANEYGQRAQIARKAITLSENRQKLFAKKEQTQKTENHQSLGDFRIV